MKVETSWLGEVEIPEEAVYRFEHGLPGFEKLRSFALLEMEAERNIQLLQSLDNKDISFLVSSPFIFYPSYEFELPEPVQEELQIEGERDLIILCILTVPNDLEKATINLLAPVILNRKSGLGKQYILRSNEYNSRHPLLQQSADRAE